MEIDETMIAISCLFEGSNKAYTYLTKDETIEVGDFVLVESNKPTSRKLKNGRPLNILSTLEVVGIGAEIKDGINYKPIVQKIDFETYLNFGAK